MDDTSRVISPNMEVYESDGSCESSRASRTFGAPLIIRVCFEPSESRLNVTPW